MEAFSQRFTHLPPFGILICKSCTFAVPPSQIKTHLKEHHSNLAAGTRRAIAEFVGTLQNVAKEKHQINYPLPGSRPIPGLPIFKNGFRCQMPNISGDICAYICRTKRGIQDHCKTRHGWSNPNKRGGNNKNAYSQGDDDSPWIINQPCQRFFEYGPWQGFFHVSLQSTPEAQPRQTLDDTADRMLDEVRDEVAQAEKERVIEANHNRYLASPWLDFMGWERHLQNFKREDMAKTMWPVKEELIGRRQMEIRRVVGEREEEEDKEEENEDQGLLQACYATKRLVRKAMAVCQPDIVGRSTLEYINRREIGESKNEKPFYAKHKANTVRKYLDVWIKLLRYIWRTSVKDINHRPGYTLTSDQEDLLTELKELSRKWASDREFRMHAGKKRYREEMEASCLAFWIAMFCHKLKGGEYESAIISGLAVLGINPHTHGWQPAINFTPSLSALVTITRAMVVYQAWIIQEDTVQAGLASGLTEREARHNATPAFETVRNMVHEFMTLTTYGGMPSPIDRILHMRTYGLRIRFDTKGAGLVTWPRATTIAINNISFTMDDIRTVVHGLNESARKNLVTELLLLQDEPELPGSKHESSYTSLPALDLAELFDNPSEMTEHWSFLDDTRNKWSVDGQKWMWKRMWNEKEVANRLVKGDLDQVAYRADIQWNRNAVEKYFRKVRTFKEELFALVHLTAGAPARGTEILSIQHQNGQDSRAQRGVFVDHGMVAFVTSYHKGYSTSQKVKIIHRYVPKEVGELVVYYLWLVEPFVRQLQVLTRQQHQFGTFIWEPEPEEELSDEEELLEAAEDEDQWMDARDREETEASNSEEGEVTGVTTRQPKEIVARNVDGFWGTDRVRKVLGRETASRIKVSITTAIWRQVYPAIQREWTREAAVSDKLGEIYDGKQKEVIGDFRERQAGHGRRMEEMIYGLLASESPFYTMTEQREFRKVSIDWHRFLHFESAWQDQGKEPDMSRRSLEEEHTKAEFRRWRQLRQTGLQQQLEKLEGPDARFRDDQRVVLEAIMSRQPRILAIMKTGGGKSLFFMLPAASSREGVTIVIVPLNSLRDDLLDRCTKAGIPCASWQDRNPAYWASIVLVTPESAVTRAFGRFIDEKKMLHQLDRIVVDECHTILDSTETWRPKVRQLCQMTEKDCQVVFLTATLRPKEEPEFTNAMGLDKHDMIIFRSCTTRSNVQYQVLEYDAAEEETFIKQLVDKKKREYPLPGQIIVYSRSVEQVKSLAQLLECSMYFREVASEQDKRKILRRLTGVQEQVWVATNALGLGVDAPSIRVVIHTSVKSNIRDYAQESGRAGRDGEKSEAIILRAFSINSSTGRKFYRGGFGQAEQAMKDLVKGDKCRRLVLDREMDGRVDRTACEAGEERCDVCEQRPRSEKRRRVATENDEQALGEASSTDKEAEDSVPLQKNIEEDVEQEEEVGGINHEVADDVPLQDNIWDDVEQEEDVLPEDEDALEARQTIETAQLREEFTSEVERHKLMRRKQIENALVQYIRPEEVEAVLQSWQDICVLCRAKGLEYSDHITADCTRMSEDDTVHWTRGHEWMDKVVFEPYACCRFCWAPQAVCHLWEEVPVRGRLGYRMSRGNQCQFPTVLRHASIALHHPDWKGSVPVAWIEEEMRKVGYDRATEGVESEERFRRWIQRMVRTGDMQMSELCRIFYIWSV